RGSGWLARPHATCVPHLDELVAAVSSPPPGLPRPEGEHRMAFSICISVRGPLISGWRGRCRRAGVARGALVLEHLLASGAWARSWLVDVGVCGSPASDDNRMAWVFACPG